MQFDIARDPLVFITAIFIRKTRIPIISITLFIIAVILNSIQYHNNDKNYLQKHILISNDKYPSGTVRLKNSILYLYNMIGINGFLNNSIFHILYLILTYFLLALIEMNIGYITLLFLLFINIMFMFFWDSFQDVICANNISRSRTLSESPYCCGSFVLFMALGFVLSTLFLNLPKYDNGFFIICIMIVLFFGIVLFENYITYSNLSSGNVKTCHTYTWHTANYIFGILCANILGN